MTVLLAACDKGDNPTIINQSAAPIVAKTATQVEVEDGFKPEPPKIPHENRLAICATSKECGEERACVYGTVSCVRVPEDEPDPCKVPCEELGLCVHTPDGCRAQTVEHCRQSTACRDMGQCSMSEGECLAASDFDCALGNNCQALGHCTASGGICRAFLERDCDAACERFGRCQRLNNTCKAVTDADCAGPCAYEGRCRAIAFIDTYAKGVNFDAGWCTWPDQGASCAGTTVCREKGQCRYFRPFPRDGRKLEWCAVSDESCAASELCKREGLCVADGNRKCKKPDVADEP